MSRRKWIGLAGVAFGVVMLVGIISSGTTPDRDGSDAAELYATYWQDSGHQDAASRGTVLLTYAVVLLVAFSSGLRHLLRRGDEGPLPDLVLAAGATSAALFGAGAALLNGAGNAAAEGGYSPEGGSALLVESIGYYTATAAVMTAAAMAVAASLSNRRSGVLPQWTIVLSGLLALAGLGSIWTAWLGFMLLPLWTVVTGICLLAVRERVGDAPRQETVSA